MCFKRKQKTGKESFVSRFCDKYLDISEPVIDEQTKYKQTKNMYTLLLLCLFAVVVLSYILGLTSKSKVLFTLIFIGSALLYAAVYYLRYKLKLKNNKSAAQIFAALNKDGAKRICVRVLKIRLALTAALAVAVYLALEISYYTYFLPGLLVVFGLIYQFLLLRFSTVKFLCKKLDKEEIDAVDEAVLKNTYNEKEKPQTVKTMLGGAAVVFAAIVLFVCLNFNSSYTTAEVDGGIKIVKYEPGVKNLFKAIEVPQTIGDKTVVAIGQKAYSGNIYAKSIIMPDTVLLIEKEAFSDCHAVTDIKLSKGVKDLGEGVFSGCKSLISIDIPSSLTKLPDYTFYNCFSLKEVTSWGKVTQIGAYAFSECDSLFSLDLPMGLTKISESMFSCCDNLKTVGIPKSVTKIEKSVFYLCTSLNNMYIPDNVKEIGQDAFGGCSSLPEIYLPKDVALHKTAFDTVLTLTKEKLFTDEENDAIDQELEDTDIKKIYVVYRTSVGIDKPSYIYRNLAITVSHTDEVFALYNNGEYNLEMLVFDSPADYLEYLKIMKEEGVMQIHFNFKSRVASEIMGEDYFVNYFFDIDEQIEQYEKNPDKF